MECWSGGVLVKSPELAVGLPAFGGATGDQGCGAERETADFAQSFAGPRKTPVE